MRLAQKVVEIVLVLKLNKSEAYGSFRRLSFVGSFRRLSFVGSFRRLISSELRSPRPQVNLPTD